MPYHTYQIQLLYRSNPFATKVFWDTWTHPWVRGMADPVETRSCSTCYQISLIQDKLLWHT